MPDVQVWLDRGLMARPRMLNEFESRLRIVVAHEMSVPPNVLLTPDKIDILDIRPLRKSVTKKVIIHVHTHLHEGSRSDMSDRLKAIGRRLKPYFDLPQDDQCVAVCFKEVGAGHWVKV